MAATIAATLLSLPATAAPVEAGRIVVTVVEYPENYKPDGMWAGLYAASSGKIYSGLCTHGGSALFYEYDPATGVNRLVADIGEFLGDNGAGARTHGKIHTRFAEDNRGRIYFATGNQGSGPRTIDPSTWFDRGSHLLRYDPSSGELEDLGQVTPNFGSYGLVMDRQREMVYLRMIAVDDRGNVYGTSQNHWIWKYDAEADRLVELPLQIPHDRTIRLNYSSGHPALDRRQIWRYVEWDPVNKKIYGIETGRSLLFEFDPADGPHGSVRQLADMALDEHRRQNRFPYATLAMGLNPGKEIYYGTVSRSFDYGADDQETEAASKTYLERFDLGTGRKQVLGTMVATDGRVVLGLGGCEVAKDGKVYFCGALQEPDKSRVAGRAAGRDPFRLQLMVWDPKSTRHK
jgi:hypothetical protein